MKIALDLDGVVTNIGEQLLESCEDLGIEITPFCVYDALTNPNGVERLESVFENPLFWRNLKPYEQSWHCINEWFMQGNDVVFITARRSEFSINEISSWLDSWRIMYSDFIVCDMGHKYEYINKIDPIIYVDDNPHEIETVIKKTKTRPYIMKTWYNEHRIFNMPSVESLYEIEIR
jgi:5'(3')-deoxyribonucleotidase